jgi:molybdate transport system permease protein
MGIFARSMSRRIIRLSMIGLASLAIGLVVLPIVALVWRTIRNQAWEMAGEGEILQALFLSLMTTAVALLAIILLGTPLAYLLARRNFAGKGLLNTLVELPIVLPPAVAGLALLLTFGRRGILGGVLDSAGIRLAFTTTAVIIAQTFIALPFYTRAAQIGFSSIDPQVEDSARVDGAAGWQVFFHITLPLASRSLVTGGLLSWARALGEFGATIVFAGSLAGETRTMPLLVYYMLERDLNAAIWTGLILVGLALAIVGITRWLSTVKHDRMPS